MTSTLQISPELRQTVIYDKINEAIAHAVQLVRFQIYDQALKTYHQILDRVALLSNREQQSYWISYVIGYYEIANLLQPLTKLPRQEQDRWIEWLEKVQQYALNHEQPVGIAQDLKQLARIYQNLGRSELVESALQQATAAAQQIPDATSRADQLIQLASIRLEFQQKAEAQQLLTQAIATVEQIPSEDTFTRGNYLVSIAFLYIQLSEVQRALALADKIGNHHSPDTIYQEIVRDAIKRGDLHLAQAVTAKIQGAEYQAYALVEMAVYWATHHQPRLGNRLFAKALKRVAKEEYAQGLQYLLIKTYSTSGQLTIVFNAIQRLTQDAHKAQALSEIALTYAQANQHQQLQKILAQLKSLNNWEIVLMSTVSNAQQYHLAIVVFNAVKNKGDLIYKSGLYRELVQALLRSQHLYEALELAKKAPNYVSPDEQSSSLQQIALAFGVAAGIAYANAQQWSQAIDVVTQIENTPSTPYQVLTRVELAATAPTPAEFTSLIQPAIAQAQALEAIEQKALALAAIAVAYLRSGNEEQAQSFLQQTIQTMQQVEDDESQSRGRLFAQINDYLIIQNQYTAALTIAQAYPAGYLQDNVYNAVFYQLNSHYAVDVALSVVEVELLPDRQATTLLAIANIYALQQRNEDAISFLDRAFAVAQKIADPESRTIIRYENTPEPDYNDRRSQYTRLVKQYVALQQIDKAQEVVEKVQEASLRDYLQAWIDC
ncbi:tetratricopeptide repeat protein [Calothrix sp. NIES-2098]|uniref:tetratricopeptide repeat protein n=1 Tax=Calothrix sp. NIES-2098 TaxID=1954171 RepID=UPI000B5F363E|nr:hypothetical protein NIES2098_37440 [Calothrix sp. NIES-2098]